MFRKCLRVWVLAAFLVTTGIVGPSPLSARSQSTPPPTKPGELTPGVDVVYHNEARGNVFEWSLAQQTASAVVGGVQVNAPKTCTAIPDVNCPEYDGVSYTTTKWPNGIRPGLSTRSILGLCRSDTELDCVSSLVVSGGTDSQNAQYVSDYVRGTPFTGSTKYGIPDGRFAPIFSASKFPHAGGDEYIVRVAVRRTEEPFDCTTQRNRASKYCRSLLMVSVPTDENQGYLVDCAKEKSPYCDRIDRYGANNQNFGLRSISIDVLRNDTRWPSPFVDLPESLTFQVTFRLSQKTSPYGWFAGHVLQPTLSQQQLSGGFQYAVGGKVSPVIGMKATTKCADVLSIPQAQLDAINHVRQKTAFSNNQQYEKQFVDQNIGKTYSDQLPSVDCSPTGQRREHFALGSVPMGSQLGAPVQCPAIRQLYIDRGEDDGTNILECGGLFTFDKLAAAQGDRTTHITNRWSLSHMRTAMNLKMKAMALEQCAGEDIVGIIGSNATMYDEMPEINPQTGQLEYGVAAPHLSLDGVTPSAGQYSLVVSKNYARCQWGIDPSSATFNLSVMEGRQLQKRSEIVPVVTDPNYFRVDSPVFHFSSPKVKVIPKDRRRATTRIVRVRPSRLVSLNRVSPLSRAHISTWHLVSGRCKVSKSGTNVRMAKSGVCRLSLSRYNTRRKTTVRTLVELRP